MEKRKQYVYTFETLDTWKKSIEFAKIIYKITDFKRASKIYRNIDR